MPRIPIEVDNREYKEMIKALGNKRWRRVLCEALGVEESPRKLGRPPRVALDSLQVGSGVDLGAGEARARAVEGLGLDQVFEESQRERERRKARG